MATEYWNTFTPQQRESYPEAKKTLMAWLAFSETACLQQYSVTRMKWTESIQQAIYESTAHVDALLGNTPPECHRFQWIKARTLAKLKWECAEAVWKLNPKNPVELAQAVSHWEETYGKATKPWNTGQQKYQLQQGPREQHGTQQQPQQQWSSSQQRQPPSTPKQDNSGGGRRCYNCGEAGHFKAECPKPKTIARPLKKVEMDRPLQGWILPAQVNGEPVLCELDSGASITVIPESVLNNCSFVPTNRISLKWLDGYAVEAPTTTVKLAIGDFLGEVEVAVVTDEVLEMPLIGRNVGEANLLALISLYGRQYHPKKLNQNKELEITAPILPVRT